MTTFADREHAMESHYALLQLAAFRERARRHKRLGLSLATRLHLHGAEARMFVVWLSGLGVEVPSDENLYRHMADELGRRGLAVTDAELRHLALTVGGTNRNAVIAAAPVGRSWPAFVTTELLSLFGDGRPEGSPPPLPRAEVIRMA
jgi:hypothetical protein